MRTTLSIDPEVLNAARKIAKSRCISIGEVISELAKGGLEARGQVGSRHGFPIFHVHPDEPVLGHVPKNIQRLTPELVLQGEDGE